MREQFNKNTCDLLMGVPAGMKAIATTQPYYKSSYVFVTRAAERFAITSFTDPHLNGRRIGLKILEEDMSPPSLPLIRSGHAAGLVGFESFGNQAGDIVRAVATQRVNVPVVWGPVAGFFAAKQHFHVALHAVSPAVDPSGIPFVYAITMGVHKRDTALRDAVNASLVRLQLQIARVLAAYHVPTLPMQRGGACEVLGCWRCRARCCWSQGANGKHACSILAPAVRNWQTASL
ncbi:hypothetical protein [Terriglobus sp.]|uniref:hypothetical protein n=1 Tax=Terriglobus sp. TaxID=1889013 RepID=UPI003AFF703B